MQFIRSFHAHFLREKAPRLLFILTAAFFLASLLFIAFSVGRFGESIILHFDHMSGIDLFGTPASVWGVWALGFAIAAVNTASAEYFFDRDRVIAYIFLAGNFLIGILLFLAVAVVASVN